jgi:hypothetical protein
MLVHIRFDLLRTKFVLPSQGCPYSAHLKELCLLLCEGFSFIYVQSVSQMHLFQPPRMSNTDRQSQHPAGQHHASCWQQGIQVTMGHQREISLSDVHIGLGY